MKKMRILLALLLSAALLLTSCSGGEKPSGQGGGSPGGAGRDSINLTLNQAVESLNPFSTASIVDMQLFCQLYETLFFVTDTGELEPRVATSYEVGEDGMTYTVHLRDDVKFHNGKTMTAQDVAWSLDYALKSGPYTQKRTNLTNFESATVVDEQTVEIKSNDKIHPKNGKRKPARHPAMRVFWLRGPDLN